LDTLATYIPLLASSGMYVAIGHVLIEIFKHVLAVWNTVWLLTTEQRTRIERGYLFLPGSSMGAL
jgi:hypothetical protein